MDEYRDVLATIAHFDAVAVLLCLMMIAFFAFMFGITVGIFAENMRQRRMRRAVQWERSRQQQAGNRDE